MLANLVQFLTVYSAPIQTATIIVALLYVILQTRQINRQLKLDNITSSSAYFRDLNELVLNNDRALQLRDVSPEVSLGNIYIGVFKARFLLRKAHLTDNVTWEADKRTMINNFRECDWLRVVWERDKNEYPRPFRDFIDKEILPSVPPVAPVALAAVETNDM
ncbi:MAG TPA: hypothetical protein VH349_04785 [Ktedonobacterales bacterium]|jgi:hypothetical protein